jgi:AraC-like DNA-binding protein
MNSGRPFTNTVISSLNPRRSCRTVAAEVLIRLNRLFAARLGGESDTRANPLAFRFRQLVEERVCREHRVAWYARSVNVSSGHLSDVSLRHLGRTAGRFIRHRLLVEAKRRLRSTDASIGRIARDLGFADPSYFGRFFLRETGLTPAAFWRAGGEARGGRSGTALEGPPGERHRSTASMTS